MYACLLKVSAIWVTVSSPCPERIFTVKKVYSLSCYILMFHILSKLVSSLGSSDAVIELLRQNAHAFSQISSNLSVSKVIDLYFPFFLQSYVGESDPNASW